MSTLIKLTFFVLIIFNYSQSYAQDHKHVRDLTCPESVGANNCVAFARQVYSCLPHGLDTVDGKKAIITETDPKKGKEGYVAIINSSTSPSLGHLGIVLKITDQGIEIAQGGGGKCEVRFFKFKKVLGYWKPSCVANHSF